MDYQYLGTDMTPEKIASLSRKEREVLCAELRDKIIKTVSANGGHLGSNLGAVELTVSLLSVFDYTKDKLIFDVGHQAYSYKLLTGRYDRFDTLRQKGGVSGFPRRSESPYDVFDTGHSSTSVSAALGFARARDLSGEDYYVVAVIGDGAMTGGLAYEALNDAGHSKTKMLIILNDNEMSIDKNVGGLSRYLKKIRISSGYISAKRNTESFLNRYLPNLGKPLVRFIMAIKDFFRFLVNRKHPSFFDDMGLVYYGPIDGHDTKSMIKAFDAVKDINKPVLLHVVTTKGKGYEPAEKDPADYHGVGPFDPEKGVVKTNSLTFTTAFAGALVDIAARNKKVLGLCAAMAQGTGLDLFAYKFPSRFFDCGIAEEHAVTMAGGLAASGYIPVVAIYSSFLQRAYDEIIHDVCFMNNHVVFAIDRAGFVGADGHTHHGLNDISYLNAMPNMTILVPRDYVDLRNCLNYAVNKCEGPVAIRYPRGKSFYDNNDLYSDPDDVVKPHIVSSEGRDYAIVTIGKMCKTGQDAVSILSGKGFKGIHINLAMVKPVPGSMAEMIGNDIRVYTIEEGIICGGAGESISRMLHDSCSGVDVTVFGVDDKIIRAASQDEQLRECGLDADSISSRISADLN